MECNGLRSAVLLPGVACIVVSGFRVLPVRILFVFWIELLLPLPFFPYHLVMHHKTGFGVLALGSGH